MHTQSGEHPHTDADVNRAGFIDHEDAGEHAATSVRAVMINRPRQMLYEFWSNPANLAAFMENVKSVTPMESGRSRWVVAGPAGKDVEFISRITEDIPGERLAWETEEGADVASSGWIEFRDNAFGRGTEVRALISYDPPMGAVGKVAAKVLQREPRVQARRDLRRFKQLMETGEIPTTEAGPAAPRGS